MGQGRSRWPSGSATPRRSSTRSTTSARRAGRGDMGATDKLERSLELAAARASPTSRSHTSTCPPRCADSADIRIRRATPTRGSSIARSTASTRGRNACSGKGRGRACAGAVGSGRRDRDLDHRRAADPVSGRAMSPRSCGHWSERGAGTPTTGPARRRPAIADAVGDLQYLAAQPPRRAEARGSKAARRRSGRATQAAFELALRQRAAELHWRARALALARRADSTSRRRTPGAVPLPDRRRLERAASYWRENGCRYEAALALADSRRRRKHCARRWTSSKRSAPDPPRRSWPAGSRARRARRAQGPVQRPARTRPASPPVSSRCCAAGRGPAQRSDRRAVGPLEKTVDHHVSAVLRKLGAARRGEATAEAAARARLGSLGGLAPASLRGPGTSRGPP